VHVHSLGGLAIRNNLLTPDWWAYRRERGACVRRRATTFESNPVLTHDNLVQVRNTGARLAFRANQGHFAIL